MKKILYIVGTLINTGPTTQLFYIIKYLDRNEFEPYLITLSPESANSKWHDFENLGVCLYTLKFSRVKGLVAIKKNLQNIVDRIKPDIIHTQGFRADIYSSKIKTNIPRINTIRNIPQFDYTMGYGRLIGNIMIYFHRRAIKKLQCTIGVSSAVTNNLKHKFKVIDPKIINNGVDTEIFFPLPMKERKMLRKKLGFSDDGLICIFSGNLIKLKDPVFLISNLKKYFCNKNNNILILLGDGKLKKECEKIAAGYNNIHIIGHVNNILDYLRIADYFISVSRSEGMPNAVLESMACGLPFLLSDITAHKEIYAMNTNAGFCYRLGNERDFLVNLEKMIGCDRDRLSAAALGIIQNRLNAKAMSKEYQNVYRGFVS
ncbi:glycosyl transferase [Spirochaetia bacterium]|nr:glycosyl transferase [Spirochaetia bacterium]